jgi:hypothetical protein
VIPLCPRPQRIGEHVHQPQPASQLGAGAPPNVEPKGASRLEGAGRELGALGDDDGKGEAAKKGRAARPRSAAQERWGKRLARR